MKILHKLMPPDDHQGVVDFEISRDKKTIRVTEGCDGYFCEDLTKAEFAQLIEELRELHAQMDD